MTNKPQFVGEYRRVKLSEICSKGKSSLRQKDVFNDGPYSVYGASGIVGTTSEYQNETPYVVVVKDGAGVGRASACEPMTSVLGTMQALIPNSNVERDYLLHLVRSLRLGEGFSGSTIPHIYFKDYGRIEVPLPSLEVQKQIVSQLGLVEAQITQVEAQIEQFDQLIKSRFVEMFGKAEDEHSDFPVKTLNDVCTSMVRGPFGSALKKEFFVPKRPGAYKVYEQKHAIQKQVDIGTYYISRDRFETLKRFECHPGDILMSCSGTMGKLYQLPQNCEPGVMNQALCKFTLSNSITADYFLGFMEQVVDELGVKGSGIKNVSSVKFIKAIRIPLPPVELQERFAAFVSQVDKSRFVAQQQVEKLQMLYDSLAQEYFGD